MSDDGLVTATPHAVGHPRVETGALSPRRIAAGCALAALGVPAMTAGLVQFRGQSGPTYESMLFLTLAVACALVGGRWPAIVASALGVLSLNYFFTEPLHTLTVASTANVLVLVIYVVVSAAVATVVDSAARRRAQATRARAEAATLAQLNRRILEGTDDVRSLLELARETFGASSVELADAHANVGPDDTAVPISGDALLVLRHSSLPHPDRRVLAAFATHVGVLREREELARQTEAARELEAGNRTRTALIAAVSHDLRTPLAGIRAATETLRSQDGRLSPADRDELLAAIGASTARLSTMVMDLLDMSRLETGSVQPVLAPVTLERAVEAALADLPAEGRVRVAAGLPTARADAGLLERALANLLSNALRHASGIVEVSGGATPGGGVELRVADHGEGIAREDRARMFEPFQTLGDAHSDDGVGLGLAVTRGLLEAQGGAVSAEDTPGGGLTMVVRLPGAR
jgi:two-component system sensor histidine kinase KdpD